MEFVIELLLAISIPLLFLVIIRQLDFYQTGQFRTILLSLALGGIAYAPAALLNGSLINSGLMQEDLVKHFIAPVTEEVLKGLFLLYLVRRSKLTYSVDGALYGFATGIGFAIFENIENISRVNSLEEILLRILSTNLVHAFSSAAIGIALGIFLLRPHRSRWLILTGGLFVAIGQHMIFNIMETGIHPIIKILPGLIGMLFIYSIMQHGRKQAQTWIREKLEAEKHITRNEAAAVNRLPYTEDILLPVAERFGAKKTEQVEKLLYLQARIGIKRKALDGFRKNDTARKDLEAEINEMRAKMKKTQREIGVYVMLFVRGLFTDEMVSVWDRMQAKIQERSAASGGQKGGGLWSSLDERVKS